METNELLLNIGVTLLIYIPFVIYAINRILDNKNISLKKKKIFIVITCINPLFGMLFYSIEANKKIKEKYSSEKNDKNGFLQEY